MRSRCLIALLFSVAVSGCSNFAYYSQAVGGHLGVMQASRAINDVIDDPECDPALKRKLEEVRLIRDFASIELGLPNNGSYRSYADIQRPFVTWNVFAAPEFSLKPETWCMFVVGCVNYRGFYNQSDAENLAKEMRQRGFDTYVGGVPAYSTLGYFSDPVLNTFLRSGTVEVARLIFHELAHQLIYVEGDTAFNESFATVVENEGLRRWLAHKADPILGRDVDDRRQHKTSLVELINSHRDKLGEIYASALPVEAKRLAKAAVMDEIRRTYVQMQEGHGKKPVYRQWLEQDLNNAKIASLALYTQLYPAFEALLKDEGNDLTRFYERVKVIAGMPRQERYALLKQVEPIKPLEEIQLAQGAIQKLAQESSQESAQSQD